MKKRLLKPAENDGQIICIPSSEEFILKVSDKHTVGTAHQPYFFNPGVALKFIFLGRIPKGRKKIFFVDTDRLDIKIKLPAREQIRQINFLNTDTVLSEYLTPKQEVFYDLLKSIENEIKEAPVENLRQVISNLSSFKEIIIKNANKKFLKEVLAKSFLDFFSLNIPYYFLSDIIKGSEFEDFFTNIYNNDRLFRDIFNESLDEYRETYRFRFKNFPFPRLQDGELPFWLIRDSKRARLFKNDIDLKDFHKITIYPRASTLTIFLRLYKFDFFIHGLGGANYEWVQDRIIERFFNKAAPDYAVISGTFLLPGLSVFERKFPYFFFSPRKLKAKAELLVAEAVTI